MKKTSKIISILLTVAMLMGLMTTATFAAQTLPTTFGWSTENEGHITIDVPEFDGDEIEYLLDLYKDGNKVSDDFGVYFDASGKFESEIFADKIKELGNGTYKYKIGFERDFDTNILINATDFSSEYVVNSYSHSIEVKPTAEPTPAPTATPSPTVDPTAAPHPTPDNTVTTSREDVEDNSPQTIIKGQVNYANKYPKKSVYDPINYGETKPLANASVNLYKKNGFGNTLPLAKANTDHNGNFELAYKQGEYDLIIAYGNSDMLVKVDANSESVDLGTIKFEPYDYKSSPNQPALILPNNTNVIEITDDNLNDYFEDVKVIGEVETDRNMLNTVQSYGSNVYCGIELPKEMFFVNLYDMTDAYANFDEENELWLISPNNAREFIDMRQGLSNQITGIYNEKNNVLYHSAASSGSGYVFSHFRKNGIVSITKFDIIVDGISTDGMSATYKITRMTGRFKNLPYITVAYNNELIAFDQKPIIENGRTLVPLRAIFEKIGATVEWNGDTQTVTAVKDDICISLTIDNTTAYKNGQAITLDVPAKIINGRTLVPVRFVADCFGVDVQWNGDIQRVVLTK